MHTYKLHICNIVRLYASLPAEEMLRRVSPKARKLESGKPFRWYVSRVAATSSVAPRNFFVD